MNTDKIHTPNSPHTPGCFIIEYSYYLSLTKFSSTISSLSMVVPEEGIYNINKIQKHFQNIMLVGMASEISKNYTYKCVDRSRQQRNQGCQG